MITINPSTLPRATVGVSYSQQLNGSGGIAPYTFTTVFGSLGLGLSLDPSGLISGTPTAAGRLTFAVQATDAAGAIGGQQFTLDIDPPRISVDPATLPDAIDGVAYLQQLTASGGTAPYTFSIAFGALGLGLSLDTNGLLSGTPTGAGSLSFGVQATDANGSIGGRQYSLLVVPRINVDPPSLPNATAGAAYSQQLTASGGTAPYGFSLAFGALGFGITLDAQGLLGGTPTGSGTLDFGVQATDATGAVGGRPYLLQIDPATIVVTPASLPGGTSGVAYSQLISASGGIGPYTFTIIAGSLRFGLILDATGLLSGTPNGFGTLDFTVQANDTTGSSGSRQYTLVVAQPPIAVDPPALPDGTVGTAYSQSIVASGGTAPYAFAVVSGALPGGLTLNASGLLGGVPTASGSSTFEVQATDANGATGSRQYALQIAPAVQPAPTIANFQPKTGPAGSQTTILGTHFIGATNVSFGAVSAAFMVVDDNTISATVPAGAVTAPLSVTTPGGTAVSAISFKVAPIISDFQPKTGLIGTQVTLVGAGFTGVTAVTFKAVSAPFVFVDDATVTATVPPGAEDGKIKLTTPVATTASAATFDVILPKINGFNPKKGGGGILVTVNGDDLGTTTDVAFNGLSSPNVPLISDHQVKAVVPAGATTGKITLTTSAGLVQSADDFVIVPRVDDFAPKSGLVGSQVTIIGGGFTGVTGVTFKNAPATFLFVDDATIKATVPAGAVDGKIIVTTATGMDTSAAPFNTIIPTITGFNPKKAVGGATVTIKGKDLATTTAVGFNGKDAGNLPLVSDTTVMAVVPSGATTGKITLTTAAGLVASADDFVVLPKISDFMPKSGPVATQVTIVGSGFTGVSSVSFKATNASFTFVNDSTVQATVPTGAQDGKIQVATTSGADSSAVIFDVT